MKFNELFKNSLLALDYYSDFSHSKNMFATLKKQINTELIHK